LIDAKHTQKHSVIMLKNAKCVTLLRNLCSVLFCLLTYLFFYLCLIFFA